jgi:hypothetical protein
MFGRKKKAALAALPPHHRSLAVDHGIAAALTPRQWDELFQSLAVHEQLVRRQPLPPRSVQILLPLVRALSQDVEPDAIIGVTADLRGPDAPGKLHPGRPLQPIPPVTKIEETISWDPWLVVSADLHDGSHLDLTVVDVTRIHKLRKRSSSGKIKWKTKRKAHQRLTVTYRSAKGAVVVPPAPSPATQWLRVSARPKGERQLVSAKAKYPLAATPDPVWQLRTIMLAIAEVVRWLERAAEDGAA